jgi:enoyl-[acyl-carrier-protein] reductase (NADH)
MTKHAKTKNAGLPMSNLMDAFQDASTKMASGFGPEWLENMNNLGTEMLAFMSERIKQDIQTQQDLLQAKGIAEVQKIQADFLKKAMDDYSAEMTKLMDVGKTPDKHATPV